MHIDLEFQNRYRPVLRDGKSYPLVKRGIYYGARDISSQLGRITGRTNYNDIEKVVSIWIVSEQVPKEIQNTATRYYIEKDDFIGVMDEPRADYDLMEVVIIRRGEAGDLTEPLFDYINSVFAADLDAIDRYTPASRNEKLKEEVVQMPGMGASIYQNGYDNGFDNGYDNGCTTTVIRLVDDGDITAERAAETLDKTLDEIQALLDEYVAKKDLGQADFEKVE
ncbi:MAG: hypothetical protein IJ679_09530 [Lachnospiraceae bacterium]|nr:hypothetical protein [Lachnospiraceae bacterium]